MGLDVLFKIAGVGILISVIHTALKQAGKEDMAHLCTLAGFSLVLLWVVELLGRLFNTVQDVFKLF
ncbi:stage III sporulation protein AC [Sporomusa acidovorans]|uniref:Stage III sporulation protein AC/AD protein family protein n=1 Tax=Sporomusa acidovorans (strain ATCC 49682 / DSM 3132 / Mol) TaxID=1123286 RepID=A0ABZ3J4P9_SPOA4|nr:stage III sporulation protein AC [Sporomusa acidovorans]OZC20376.1 stage III sporulation protein AC/AD protein family protein [Sporomusa acidovorans DSM 3132]SDD36190.1 stage III sporulation protein AC [Sporomusa acidovorans]